MAYVVHLSDEFKKSWAKLKRRNPIMFERIEKKIREIIENPEHYKPLKYDLHGFRRVRFGSFVLKYSVEENVISFIMGLS